MGTYHQLTEYQRYQIYALKNAGHDQQCIAAGKTISRELQSQSRERGYRPGQAHHKALARRRHKAKATKMTALKRVCVSSGVQSRFRVGWRLPAVFD